MRWKGGRRFIGMERWEGLLVFDEHHLGNLSEWVRKGRRIPTAPLQTSLISCRPILLAAYRH